MRKDCNELVVKLHAIGELKDELLQPITGMKCKNNAYCKVNGAWAKYFHCNAPAYAYPLFKTHKLTPETLLNVDIKEIPVRLLQSAGNISTSRITGFLEFTLKPISAEFCKNCQERILSRQRSIHWRPAYVERAPYEKTRNCKAQTSVLHCSGRCESTLPKRV